ncbi:unnamed protein product, partial [Protopolystoma xenopodis]
MARRRKIDPREAEERRYLIRQNKKLLNQLYESAKKIERLEGTKIELKEQLELLDFQMMELENHKSMLEEELKQRPAQQSSEVQTEDIEQSAITTELLREEASALRVELTGQKALVSAANARHSHMENLLHDLRRDNIDLREQLAALQQRQLDTDGDVGEDNSLTESDKHLRCARLHELM